MDRSIVLTGQFQKAKAMKQGKIKYRKILKISTSMYNPPKPVTQKTRR